MAMPYSPAKEYAPMIAAAMIKIGIAVDIMPTPRPEMMVVAGPVRVCSTIDFTGAVWVPVKIH